MMKVEKGFLGFNLSEDINQWVFPGLNEKEQINLFL